MPENIEYLNQQGKRKNIEDTLFPLPGTARNSDHVFIVCDGVGGEHKGEVASQMVSRHMGRVLSAAKPETVTAAVIQEAASGAVAAMRDYAEQNPDAQNMSTTLALCYFQQNGVWVAWCGDSRVYHLRNGVVLWKTKDHSLVQQLVDAGEITEEEALDHPRKNIILRSLSASSDKAPVETHFISDVQEGDYFLLCTDGLLEQIHEEQLFEILNPANGHREKRNRFLDYCEGKTSDNFSMYLLQAGASIRPRSGLRIKKALWMVAVLLLLLAGSYYLLKGKNGGQVEVKSQPPKAPVTVPGNEPKQSGIPLPTLQKKEK